MMIPYETLIGEEHLTFLDLIFTHGFIVMFAIVWSPLLVLFSLYFSFKHYLRKKYNDIEEKKEEILKKINDVC